MNKERFEFPVWSIPIALLVLAFFSFGILAPKLGFYWDDWAKVYVHEWQGSRGFWQYYLEDRPLSAWTHMVLTPLLGSSPLKWQIFGILLRWVTAWAFWWVLTLIWPRAQKHAAFTSALFLVYPLFTMQPLAVTFHQQWMQYLFYFLSVGWMIVGLRAQRLRWGYLILSLGMMAAHLSITEYFIAVEALRPLILWLVCSEEGGFKQILFWVLKRWWGYAGLGLGFIVYRLFLIQLPGDDPNQVVLLEALRTAPKETLINFTKTVFADTFYVLVTQWQSIADIGVNEIFPLFPDAIKLSWIAGALVAGLFLWYWLRLSQDGRDFVASHPHWIWQMLGLGLITVLLGCLPAWAAGRRIWFDAHSSRYALPAIWGASMVWTALFFWAVPKRVPRAVLMSLLLGLVVIAQIQNGAAYQKNWEDQRSFYWQLFWRAPMLQRGTAVLAQNELFPNQGSFAISSAINILYEGYPAAGEKTPYWFYALNPRFETSSGHPLDIPLRTQFRTFSFEGTTTNSILVSYDPGRMNCVWVLEAEDVDNPYLPALTLAMLPASNLERILPVRETSPSQEIFGESPEHEWCYFYQKASLAKQNRDWQTVVQLAEQVRSEFGYHPHDQWFKTQQEWLVFLEGYAHLGEWEQAAELSTLIVEREPAYVKRVCQIWSSLDPLIAPMQESDWQFRQEFMEQLHCAEYFVK